MQYVAFSTAWEVEPLLHLYRKRKVPVESYIAANQLPATLLYEPGAVYPSLLLSRFCAASARAEGIENAGLLAGERSSDLRQFRANADRLSRRCSASRLEIARNGDECRLSLAVDRSLVVRSVEYEQLQFMSLVNMVRAVSGPNWRPAAAGFESEPRVGLDQFETLSSARIHFRQSATWISVPRRVANQFDHWFPPSDSLPREFAASLQLLLETLLPEGRTDVNCVAAMIHMSRRSLQRRLAESGQTFSSLLAQARFAVARRRLLDRSSPKVIDIAFELGYTDPSHFTNAFRRWVGVSPSVFRLQLNESAYNA